MDIRDLEFIGINLSKGCYTYRFDLRSANEWNKSEGIFIRSQHGEVSYELNINLLPGCSTIDVDIYPYAQGRISYEIYTWNSCGFTKSTEKIVIFNELDLLNAKKEAFKNKNIYLLGQSECGLKYTDKEQTKEEEMVIFPFQGKHLSMKNGALMCDEFGDVASWGQMYFS